MRRLRPDPQRGKAGEMASGPVIASPASVEFRILGPLEVVDAGEVVDVGAGKQRALLAALLLAPNRSVSKDDLIEALWGERPTETASKGLHVYISHLRKAVGRDRILTHAHGYELRTQPGELDLERFQTLVADRRLDEALALWRGQPLADFAYEPFAQSEIARLSELRLGCLEDRVDAELEAGRHAAVVGELEGLVRAHPLRERLRAQLMLALYRSGRQAEALDAYAAGRAILSEELGLEPGAELRELQRAILAQDPALLPTGAPDNAADAPSPPRTHPFRASRSFVRCERRSACCTATSSPSERPSIPSRFVASPASGSARFSRHSSSGRRRWSARSAAP